MSLSLRNHVQGSHLTGSHHTWILPPLPLFHHQLLLHRFSTHNLSRYIHLRYLHTAMPKSASPDRAATATLCLSTFRTASFNTCIPTLTALSPLHQLPMQRHHIQHHLQLSHRAPFHHHHNLLHLPCFHHYHHFQNSHSRISRPISLLPPSSGSLAARLLQRLQICLERPSLDGFVPLPQQFHQDNAPQLTTPPFIGLPTSHWPLDVISNLLSVSPHYVSFLSCAMLVPQPFELPTRSFALHHLRAMSSHQPPSEGSDASFWASVYTHERPNVLCGVITDINLHRFTLHQHLTTHRALTETPLLHPPFQQALPDALQTHVQLYTTSIHQIDIHLRRALTALDTMGRRLPTRDGFHRG